MKNYYKLIYNEDDEYEIGVGYIANKDDDLYLDSLAPHGDFVSNWKPVTFELRNGIFMDLLSSDCERLYSPRIVNIINEFKSDKDCIQWLKVYVVDKNETLEYFILHFSKLFDAIDRDQSMMYEGRVIKPVFYEKIITDHSIFLEDEFSETPIVSEEIKKVLKEANVTGIDFSSIKLS